MTVKLISTTNVTEAEVQIQQTIDDAATLGKTLQQIQFSTCAAVVSQELKAFVSPEERSACWYSALLIFSD